MMSSLKCPLYKSLYSTITFKKVMVVVCGVLLMINSVGTVVAGNPFFNQTIRAATTPSGANQPLINQQLYGFDGQLTDPESGYQFLGRGYHRAYNPVTRRFMSQDSMSPFSKGGFNGYIFARNNPIMHQDPSGHMSTNFWINIGAILGAIVGAVLAPFTGGSTAVIAAGEVAAAAGATSGALGAAGAATHNKALQKASLGLGIAGAAIDAVNIIGSGAKLVASSADAGVTAASDGSKISTTVGGGAAKIADGEDIPMQEISACFTARTAIATNKVSQHKNIKEIGLGENVLTTSPQTKKSNIATPSYDLIPIMPKTWEEVDLSYHDIIDGKSYPASIKLLRPVAWLKSHGMHNLGSNVTLSIPEFGINAIYTQVTAIKPTTLNTANVDWSKHGTRPVIGKFKRYAPIAKTYMFKNLTTGKVSTVNATPNHPFYVKNKKAFVPIQDVSSSDQLISATGQKIELVCLSGKITHCGIQYKYGRPAPVYNLEVYRKHVYFVSNNNILVHNACDYDGYEFLGYHGTTKISAESIMRNGPKTNYVKFGIEGSLDSGEGFYVTRDLSVAESYADDALQRFLERSDDAIPSKRARTDFTEQNESSVLEIYGKIGEKYQWNIMDEHINEIPLAELNNMDLSVFNNVYKGDEQMIISPKQFGTLKFAMVNIESPLLKARWISKSLGYIVGP